MPKLAKYFLISLVIFSLGLTTNIRAQDESTVSEDVQQDIELDEDVQAADLDVSQPNVLPDSPLYFFKNLGRNIQTLFTFDPVAKTELKEKFANEKLLELKEMIERNKSSEAIGKALENYEGEVEAVNRFAERIRTTAQENEQIGTFLDKYTQHQALHQRVLNKLEEQVPEEVFEKIKESRELHLENFSDVMQKLEDKDKIAERLEKNLELLKGSDFKDFTNMQIIEDLKEKLPEDIRIEIEEKQEQILERLHEKLENLPTEKTETFSEYIKEIAGDTLQHLDIIGALEGKELSDDLRSIVESARNQITERVESQYQNRVTKQMAEGQIENAQQLLEKVSDLITEKDTTIEEIPDAFRLIEEAEKKLTLAKQEFEQENYARAYAQASAVMSLAKNAMRIMEIRAGYDSTTSGTLNCTDIDSPVCGEDGTTYRNICEAKRNEAEIAYRGTCESNIECIKEGDRVNRNPLLGTVEARCCQGLEEIRMTKSYSICREAGVSLECTEDEDCPLPRCLTATDTGSKCVEGKCVLPRCTESTVCIQVITPARNQSTGECKTFSTPCDVPSGWTKDASCGLMQLKERIQTQIQTQLKAAETNE